MDRVKTLLIGFYLEQYGLKRCGQNEYGIVDKEISGKVHLVVVDLAKGGEGRVSRD